MAEKLYVSRQAITKWKLDKEIPDIENLQNIPRLFGINIDSLLDDGDEISDTTMKENINIDDYQSEGKFTSKYDVIVKSIYLNADSIFPLVRRENFSLVDKVVDFIVQPGVLKVAEFLNNLSS